MLLGNFIGTTLARKQFRSLPIVLQLRIQKKFEKISAGKVNSRHLRFGEPFSVEEFGQYRVLFKSNENIIFFIGEHKEHEHYLKTKINDPAL